MQIVKLDAIDSTNAYLKRTMQIRQLEDYTVALTNEQSSGRGQQGANWVSEPGKNLIFSVFKKCDHFLASHHFYLNLIVSLAIYRTLKSLDVPDLHIKWPNDILSGNSKICGILIETVLAGEMLKSAIIGVGLNLNQTKFPGLPNASSLKLLVSRSFDSDMVLKQFIADLKYRFRFTRDFELQLFRKEYERNLFMKDKQATLILTGELEVKGIIRGVSEEGKLIVALGEKELKEFDLKELKMLY